MKYGTIIHPMVVFTISMHALNTYIGLSLMPLTSKTGLLCITGIKLLCIRLDRAPQQEACQKKSSPTLQLPTTNANQTFLYCVRLIAQLNIYFHGFVYWPEHKNDESGKSATLACIIAESVCHWTNPICTEIHISDFHTVGLSIPSLVPQWSNLPKVSILL